MKIESINIARPVTINHAGKSVATGIYKQPTLGPVAVTKLGLEGDTIVDRSVHGGEDQAVYIYSENDNTWWATKLNRPITPGTFGENLTISEFSTNSLRIGDRLHINEVVLEISAPRTPCFKLAEKMGISDFIKQFANAVKPGAYARVITEGNIKSGDDVKIVRSIEDYALVNEVFIEWHSSKRSLNKLRKALDSPISNYHRKIIQGWYDQLTTA